MAYDINNLNIPANTEPNAGLSNTGAGEAPGQIDIIHEIADMALKTLVSHPDIKALTSSRFGKHINKMINSYSKTGTSVDIPLQYRANKPQDGYKVTNATNKQQFYRRTRKFRVETSKHTAWDTGYLNALTQLTPANRMEMYKEIVREIAINITEDIANQMSDVSNVIDGNYGANDTWNNDKTIESIFNAQAYLAQDDSIHQNFFNPIEMDMSRASAASDYCLVSRVNAQSKLSLLFAQKGLDNYTMKSTVSKYYDNVVDMKRRSIEAAPHFKTGTRSKTATVNQQKPATLTLTNGSQLVVSGVGANATVLKNEAITIENVNRVNKKYKNTVYGKRVFKVTEDATADSSGEITLKIFPELNDGTLKESSDSDAPTLSGEQNIDAFPANGAVVTFFKDPEKEFETMYLHHPHQIELAFLSQMNIESAVVCVNRGVPNIGNILQLTKYHDGDTDEETTKLKYFYGVKMLQPELGVQIIGPEVT